MKCSICRVALGPNWLLVTEAYARLTRTIAAHPHCLEKTLGHKAYRDLRSVIGTAGWVQDQSPGFRPSDLVPQ